MTAAVLNKLEEFRSERPQFLLSVILSHERLRERKKTADALRAEVAQRHLMTQGLITTKQASVSGVALCMQRYHSSELEDNKPTHS